MTVINPRPPSWIIARMTTCPNRVQCAQVSTRIRPVTQDAEVAVKRAGERIGGLPVPAGHGKHEQQCSQQNDHTEGGDHDAGWVQILHAPKPVADTPADLERHKKPPKRRAAWAH